MKDSFSNDRTGWARFSDNEVMRYRLARSLVPLEPPAPDAWRRSADGRPFALKKPKAVTMVPLKVIGDRVTLDREGDFQHVVFVLLNPSTATAFKPDNTVTKCGQFATLWGAHLYEVVNVYAFRSPYPTDLDVELAAGRPIGTDADADNSILDACRGATRVIAAWGNNATRIGRADQIRRLLAANHIPLEHLGLTNSGMPMHPLSRGKGFIPLEREPVVWTRSA